MEIRKANVHTLLKTEEKLVKFADEEAANEYSFNVVKKLEAQKLLFPGNGRIYADFSTRTLTDNEVKFLDLPV